MSGSSFSFDRVSQPAMILPSTCQGARVPYPVLVLALICVESGDLEREKYGEKYEVITKISRTGQKIYFSIAQVVRLMFRTSWVGCPMDWNRLI